jgi:hypothetical protein
MDDPAEPGPKINVAEQRPRSFVRSAHDKLRSPLGVSESSSSISYDEFFNSLLSPRPRERRAGLQRPRLVWLGSMNGNGPPIGALLSVIERTGPHRVSRRQMREWLQKTGD